MAHSGNRPSVQHPYEHERILPENVTIRVHFQTLLPRAGYVRGPRRVIAHPDCSLIFRRYLAARRLGLERAGKEEDASFPSINRYGRSPDSQFS